MKRGRISLVVALLAVPSMASAQYGSHSGISTEYSFGGRMVYDELDAFGTCFATKQTRDALRLVGTEAASVDEARVYKQLFSKEQFCLGDLAGLHVPWRFVRGAVGEGLYTGKVPVPASFVAPPSMPAAKVQSVMDAAICYAAAHTADARRLIEATKPGSREETAAIDALKPDFVACLPPNMPAGFRIDTILLRYRIAEALWRLGQVHS
jgi:hypothetical protein